MLLHAQANNRTCMTARGLRNFMRPYTATAVPELTRLSFTSTVIDHCFLSRLASPRVAAAFPGSSSSARR